MVSYPDMDREEREGYQSDQCKEISKELEHLFIMRDILLDELPNEPWVQEHFLKPIEGEQ